MIPTNAGTSASRENSIRNLHVHEMLATSRASSAAGKEAFSTSMGLSHVRIRAHRFGDHVEVAGSREKSGKGALCMLPMPVNSTLSHGKHMFENQKRILVKLTYGEQVDFHRLVYENVQLFLLPEGEEITDSCKYRKVGLIVILVESSSLYKMFPSFFQLCSLRTTRS